MAHKSHRTERHQRVHEVGENVWILEPDEVAVGEEHETDHAYSSGEHHTTKQRRVSELPKSQINSPDVNRFITRLRIKLGLMSPRHSSW